MSLITAPDVIDGGAGRDTLNVTVANGGASALGNADISNIEVVNVRSLAAASTIAVKGAGAAGEHGGRN